MAIGDSLTERMQLLSGIRVNIHRFDSGKIDLNINPLKGASLITEVGDDYFVLDNGDAYSFEAILCIHPYLR